MKKPWILIGILLMANAAWAQSEDAASNEPTKTTQSTGVLSSFSSEKNPPSFEASARNILVKNIPYPSSAVQPQTSGESKKTDPVSAAQAQPPAESKKPVLSSTVKWQTSVESRKPDPPSIAPAKVPVESKKADPSSAAKWKTSIESRKSDPPSATPSKASVEPTRPVPQSKPTGSSSVVNPKNSACRLGGYIEEEMSPDECRRYGGMIILTSQASVVLNQPAPPSTQEENVSLFDQRNLVCRLRGHEKKGLSPQECREQGGMMITTGDVPTYHKPPANGKFDGRD